VPRALEVQDPELPLLEDTVPFQQGLLGNLHSVNLSNGLFECFLSVPLPPLSEEDAEGFSCEETLEHQVVHTGCQTILDVVCQARESLFVHDIVSVSSKTYNEMVLI
jgi:hypothetical protein